MLNKMFNYLGVSIWELFPTMVQKQETDRCDNISITVLILHPLARNLLLLYS